MSPIASLSRVAEENGRIIASLQCWPVELRTPDQATPLLMLGQVAVLPELQRSGVGKALMQETLKAADDQGVKACMLIGEAAYVGMLGFGASHARRWGLPGPRERHQMGGANAGTTVT